MATFTEDAVKTMVSAYTGAVEDGANYEARSAVVKSLAEKFETTVPAVRGKLVSEKVYVPKEKAEKSKTSGSTKEDLRKAFEAATALELKSMENMTKKELEALWKWHVETFDVAVADADAGS